MSGGKRFEVSNEEGVCFVGAFCLMVACPVHLDVFHAQACRRPAADRLDPAIRLRSVVRLSFFLVHRGSLLCPQGRERSKRRFFASRQREDLPQSVFADYADQVFYSDVQERSFPAERRDSSACALLDRVFHDEAASDVFVSERTMPSL